MFGFVGRIGCKLCYVLVAFDFGVGVVLHCVFCSYSYTICKNLLILYWAVD